MSWKFAVVEISGRQYKLEPGKSLVVDFLGDVKTLKADKVLMLADDKGIKVGTPYLKETLDLEVEGSGREKKIRVATYKPKANYRRVIGSRRKVSKVKFVKKD
ncbi:MAG: hypothetical protein US86_C0001G0071 [Candidatus Daviesbacteria bacterium GW2011_GWA2_38_24]|uniref:50S ribosomal protein L21 n=1 Tax=Candidatus Daviesbacteria bacterium GW2011_GWA2_38_24 TaxID=1618422 RepID=A0A0G0M0I4_9BACT|nr:MAG: hypothetical protein US86_C0001G0071 [Candidatus Daviesbacteria bacterium GW2011_GWA2_38_24]KKQ79185.1 MAG: hypothetical protein UT01_C0048G0004 [Candidatus Daviesbacteria bacterium GW2011_GWA1_38_7]OGE23508.1 MAG: 50S ribosomal protein L21 [Candidatus Daviesbacteria bacterium RIFCSPHIGHO2_01_FULL_38_8]